MPNILYDFFSIQRITGLQRSLKPQLNLSVNPTNSLTGSINKEGVRVRFFKFPSGLISRIPLFLSFFYRSFRNEPNYFKYSRVFTHSWRMKFQVYA